MSLRQSFITIGSNALALSLMLFPLAANADDGENKQRAATATVKAINPDHENFKVFKGGDTHRKEVVRSATAQASNDRLAVTIYGIDQENPQSFEFYSNTLDAVSEAQKDYTEVVLVVGTSDPSKFDVGYYQDQENPMHLEIYANGDLINNDAPILPFLNTDQGLIPNPDFESDASAMFGIAKESLAESSKIDRARQRKLETKNIPSNP